MKRPSLDLLALATVLGGAAFLDACRSDDYLGPAPVLSASHMVLGTSTVPLLSTMRWASTPSRPGSTSRRVPRSRSLFRACCTTR